MRLAARDLYRLRRASLETQRILLRAQSAQQALGELTLELERKYGLLGTDAMVDIHTGKIQVRQKPVGSSKGSGPETDAATHGTPVESMPKGDGRHGSNTDADPGTQGPS